MSTHSIKLKVKNRLAQEKSPYLLQHQYNPVDWYPWGVEAFQKARNENKPIFLSIGYSTCHWCHVMERETFEDATIGQFLSEHFVSIKVDREERPDVDKIYMTASQAMGEGGGWPLNVFLTPRLIPFFGGTYFPPEPKYGRSSFMQVLQQLVELWKTKQNDIETASSHIHDQLRSFTKVESPEDAVLAPTVIHRAVATFKRQYDPQYGGFGRTPKFPRPTEPSLLLWHGLKYQDEEAIHMVLHTCKMMAAGGMYDQLGGGFARYSVDQKWLVPHFEKMLYDNAQLVNLYLDAYLVARQERFARVARETLDYVLRDMTHPKGGFFSAEDADSEGKEGKFYTWTTAELQQLLSPDEFKVAVRYFGMSEEGNFLDHSDPEPLRNQNVLSVVDPTLKPEESILLETAKKKMTVHRNRRVRPHLDDKVLASWNGLMLGAMARAGIILESDHYLQAAEKNASFIKLNLWRTESRSLGNRWRDGHRDDVQLLTSYAHMLNGMLELYQATLEPEHLQFAVELADSMIEKFYDSEKGGFWQSTGKDPDLILRLKDDYDGAEPSGNSAAILGLLKLGNICGSQDYKYAAEKSLQLFAERMQQVTQAVPLMLAGLQFWLEEPKRLVIAGSPGSDDFQNLLLAAHSVYQPHKVIVGTSGPVEPFARTIPEQHGRATAYFCTGNECKPPTTHPAELQQMLDSKNR